jgi:hypothetical protein
MFGPIAEKLQVWLVDVDGTLALGTHRDPYDWRSADKDLPNVPVITAVQALSFHPEVSSIIAVSGRSEIARSLTEAWLSLHNVPFSELFMRPDGDFRSDDVVKEELFRRHIEPRYHVIGAIDDRDRVVRMWRRLGLVCFQVAEGDF